MRITCISCVPTTPRTSTAGRPASRCVPRGCSRDAGVDAGCGYGRIALEMARYGTSVHGVDRSRHLIELARTGAACHHLPAGFEATDLRHLTARGAFDAALMRFTTFGVTPPTPTTT
ncbi:hypothetical protein SRIMM317S_04964 [Streptomyces rimosus subsp. rimosus]